MGILWIGYLPGGVRSGPIELETAGAHLVGMPNRAPVSFLPRCQFLRSEAVVQSIGLAASGATEE